MRIAITGSHGVGKSTLCRAILRELNPEEELVRIATTGANGVGKSTLSKLAAGKLGYRFIPEAAFECYQAGFKLNEQTGMAAEMWILCRQIEQEQKTGDNWVSDRCLIDTLAYSHHLFPKQTAFLEVMRELALPYIRKYDLVVYLPSGQFPIEDDGHRSLDTKFQTEIDKSLWGFLTSYQIPHVEVRGTPAERFATIKSLIDNYSRGM